MAVTNGKRKSDWELFAYLEQAEARLREISEQGLVLDPIRVEKQLLLDATFIRDAVDAVLDDVANRKCAVDLNSLVNAACRELLVSAQFPIVIKTALDSKMPEIDYPSDLLLAVILRGLKITAEYGGPGCQLGVATSYADSIAEVSMFVEVPREPIALPVDLRAITLTEMLENLGAEVSVVQKGEIISLSLAFAVESHVS